jgi:uncharacterized membrane protein YjjB (DUF3815 family)
MDIRDLCLSGLWSGLLGAGLGILFTAPPRYLVSTFFCAAVGRPARDVLVGQGMNPNWATAIAAALVVLVAAAILRRRSVSPVVLVSAVFPLGAAVAMFQTIIGVMRVSVLRGDALGVASVALSANISKTFMLTLSIVVGMGAGMAIVRWVRREAIGE